MANTLGRVRNTGTLLTGGRITFLTPGEETNSTCSGRAAIFSPFLCWKRNNSYAWPFSEYMLPLFMKRSAPAGKRALPT